jgi:predicted DNA-binding ribbon-helix-helix protein
MFREEKLPTVSSDSDIRQKNTRAEDANQASPLAKLFTLCSPEQARELYTPERRSVRIHGHSTTIRLERAYWSVMEGLAEEENTSVAGLITRIHDHCQFSDQKNLASCLRVLCLKYVEGGIASAGPGR